jgi:hypothetical protein
VDNSVWMEIESLRRATLAALRVKYREVFQEETCMRHREHLFRRMAWRLQALAEGDLSERARGRAQQIAQDADLRMIAPRDFVVVEGERVRTAQGDTMKNFKALGSILLAKDMAERKLNVAEVQQYRAWIDAIAERVKQQTAAA